MKNSKAVFVLVALLFAGLLATIVLFANKGAKESK